MEPFTTTTDLTERVHRIMGFHVAETAAGTATVTLRNGGASGAIFLQIELAADESRHFAAERPILFPSGLHITVSGSVNGAIQPG